MLHFIAIANVKLNATETAKLQGQSNRVIKTLFW